MRKNTPYYLMMAGSVMRQDVTPVERDMITQFLRGNDRKAAD